MIGDRCIGTIVSKLEPKNDRMRGYIAMLAVDPTFRGRKIGINYFIVSLHDCSS
jgi:ribosomal protein S18 acetylase RimI-like enzyme